MYEKNILVINDGKNKKKCTYVMDIHVHMHVSMADRDADVWEEVEIIIVVQ